MTFNHKEEKIPHLTSDSGCKSCGIIYVNYIETRDTSAEKVT